MPDSRPEEWWPFRGAAPDASSGPAGADPTLQLPTAQAPGWQGPAPTQYSPPPYWPPPPPNAWAAHPAPRPPARRTGLTAAVLTLFLVGGIVVGYVLHGLFLERAGGSTTPTVAPVGSSGARTPTPTANRSGATTAPNFTPYQVPPTELEALPQPTPGSRAERVLQSNALYAMQFPVPTTCPVIPAQLSSKDRFRELSRQLVQCHFDAWKPVFEELGMEFSEPSLVLFNGRATTECGTVSDEQSFYCPVSREIYLSEERFDSSRDWWRLHFANTISHEFMHHVQSAAGILQAAYALDLREDERVRRVELQAYCMTSRLMVITPAYKFGDEDYRILKQWTTEGGSDTHGSVESREHWWLRGLEQSTPAGCNTWVVPADQVS